MSMLIGNLGKIDSNLNAYRAWGTVLGNTATLLERLVTHGDPAILSRCGAVTYNDMKFELDANGHPTAAVAVIGGTDGKAYNARINFATPSHRCSCQDWVQRRRACKHVLAVAVRMATKLRNEERTVASEAHALETKVEDLHVQSCALLSFSQVRIS